MATVTLANTTANLSGAEIVKKDGTHTITGAWTYDKDPSAPFVVTAGSAVVANLDADKVDGVEVASLLRSDAADTKDVGDLTFNDSINLTFGTGGDADVYYDGTDLIIDTQVVGTGVLSLTRGQLKFPAAQNASTDVNTLDDYEEGTWTPTIGGSGGQSGQVYTTQEGSYVKIGALVVAGFTITLSTLGTITTAAQIQGFPFTCKATTNGNVWSAPVMWASTTSSFVSMSLQFPAAAGTVANLVGLVTAAGTSNITAVVQGDLANTTSLRGVVSYRV